MEWKQEKPRWMEERDEWKLLRGKAKRLIKPSYRPVVERWYNTQASEVQRRGFRGLIREIFADIKSGESARLSAAADKATEATLRQQAVVLYQMYGELTITDELRPAILQWLTFAPGPLRDLFRNSLVALNSSVRRDVPCSETKSSFPRFEKSQSLREKVVPLPELSLVRRSELIRAMAEQRRQQKGGGASPSSTPFSMRENCSPCCDVDVIREAIQERRSGCGEDVPVSTLLKAHEPSQKGGPLAHMVTRGVAATVPSSVDHYRNFGHLIAEMRRAQQQQAQAQAQGHPGGKQALSASAPSLFEAISGEGPCNPRFTASTGVIVPAVRTPKLLELTSGRTRRSRRLPAIVFE